MTWQTVIGFEIHVELGTNSKMFCGCPADHFGVPPNTQTCPVCLGLPGALPVPNAKAIDWCIKLGLALNCQINKFSKFDRKNYFYPDLSKGYQISQYDQPFCHSGDVVLSTGKKVRINRVHMEEDTGKLAHQGGSTLIDFNRSGVPLVEIVTEPDFSDTEEALEYLREIQLIVRTLGISSADMEKGSMRLEANISVRPEGQKELPKYKIEVKNVNSFRFIKKAIDFEVARQIEILEAGNVPVQETRGFSENSGETFSQRKKEEANEYRYFPEPDIPPFNISDAATDRLRKELPMLPAAQRTLLVKSGISVANANLLVTDISKYEMYGKLIAQGLQPIKVADIIINAPSHLLLDMGKIITWSHEKQQVTVDQHEISTVVKSVIAGNPKAVDDFRQGKESALYFFVGQVKRQVGNVEVTLIKNEIMKNLK